jgi:hypothetical protein
MANPDLVYCNYDHQSLAVSRGSKEPRVLMIICHRWLDTNGSNVFPAILEMETNRVLLVNIFKQQHCPSFMLTLQISL